jgi:hypothetical protein
MRNILIGFLSSAMLISCSTDTENKSKVSAERADTLLSFSIITKDSAHLVNYRFERKSIQDKGFSFKYLNASDSFTLFLDTSKGGVYSGKFGRGGAVNLDLEKIKYYAINGDSFNVLKLVGDKNVTDGAFSIFVSPVFGLLVSKSNNWRVAKIICPDNSNTNYVQLSTLLFRMQTDDDFFTNPVPDIDKKITPPKFE